MRASGWELAGECVEEALRSGTAPSLERLGRLGQVGTLPSFLAALGADEDLETLVADYARERESLGLAPAEIVAELLAAGRVLERHGEAPARAVLDRCLLLYFEGVTGDLAERARRDPLTGLLNHRAFHAVVAAELSRARRYRGRLALLLFDLDRLKETNDREGHAEGDRLLRSFAHALAAAVRETDAVGRLGGDEFAVLLLHADPRSATAFLERLQDRLPEGISVSAGTADLAEESGGAERLLALADRRLYAEKATRAA